RMILEARARGAVAEVLVIASALSVQDVRDRPIDAQQQADQQHAKFDDEKSEFSGYLRLWKWLQDARGGKVVAQSRREMAAQAASAARVSSRSAAFLPAAQRSTGAQAPAAAAAPAWAPTPGVPEAVDDSAHKISNRQWEQLLRQN